ncbi:response regulator receiver protein [Candidatus Scalindua japonica]|uniref:Response regulator receiver protein n=1 Tax=Candidatus Scalindua japonica TaxID=1284222 RepID=A0A286TYZ5_9BACT|nr:response regulator [Candidatus Scalindua japonica]GAX61100.1 response regulator receiver protein [Candidatus Scalindua japonica]
MKKQIMVVDDDPSIRSTVEIILNTKGYSICTVESGERCLDKLREGFRGLILMDIMMPKMDGWDTISIIEDEGLHGGNVICMLTAVHDPGPKLEKLTEYVMNYVRKPFTSEELLETVAEHIDYVQ